jgi:transposase
MEKFTLQQRIFLYDSYVKCNSARKSQRKFGRKFPGVRVPTRYAIHYLVNKVRKTGVLRDSKPKRQRRVLTEEKLDEIGALFEQSPRMSLNRIAQETGVSIGTVRTARELLQLRPYETTGVFSLQPPLQ